MLQIIGAVMEWIIGNTFPFVVFASYGKEQQLLARIGGNTTFCRMSLELTRRAVQAPSGSP